VNHEAEKESNVEEASIPNVPTKERAHHALR
jgi:hypothetical protein